VYFFAGLGKLNVLYAVNVHDSMMAGIVAHLPSALAPLFSVPWVTPIAEMAIGLAVLMPGRWATRRFVLGAALAMHAFILVMLLSVSVDFTVVPFNVSLTVLGFGVLFDRDERDATLSIQPARTASGKVAILFGVIAPLLSLIGLLDMYQSHAYYAGSEPRVRWFASPAATERLRTAAWPGRMGQRMFRQDASVPARRVGRTRVRAGPGPRAERVGSAERSTVRVRGRRARRHRRSILRAGAPDHRIARVSRRELRREADRDRWRPPRRNPRSVGRSTLLTPPRSETSRRHTRAAARRNR
jgi:hypothetical protein